MGNWKEKFVLLCPAFRALLTHAAAQRCFGSGLLMANCQAFSLLGADLADKRDVSPRLPSWFGRIAISCALAAHFGQLEKAIQGESKTATLTLSLSQNAGRPDTDRTDFHAIVHDFEVIEDSMLDHFPFHVATQIIVVLSGTRHTQDQCRKARRHPRLCSATFVLFWDRNAGH